MDETRARRFHPEDQNPAIQSSTLSSELDENFRPMTLSSRNGFMQKTVSSQGPLGLTERPTEPKRRTLCEIRASKFEGPRASKHHQNSTRRPPRERKKNEHCGGRGKKKARNFGPPKFRLHPSGSPSGPLPFGAPPFWVTLQARSIFG